MIYIIYHPSALSIHRPPVAGVDLAFDSYHMPGPLRVTSKLQRSEPLQSSNNWSPSLSGDWRENIVHEHQMYQVTVALRVYLGKLKFV